MKFVIAPDSFKGSLTAQQVAVAIKTGLQRVFPNADYDLIPIADGGEGTVAALVAATGGQLLSVLAHDPNGKRVTARYGILGDGETAFVETVATSGIQYLDSTSDPLTFDTYGTGELIKAALSRGVRRIIIGLGGSGTTDGGSGMIWALGGRFLNRDGNELPAGGGALSNLDYLDLNRLDLQLKNIKLILASDVTNPLTGENGAAPVFAPQKGATPSVVVKLAAALRHYGEVIATTTGRQVATMPGAGAAGGLGAGFLAFTNAEIRSGIDVVLRASHFAKRVQDADFVITGEGQLDDQTRFGKAPYGVAKATKQSSPQTRVIAIAASLGDRVTELYADQLIDVIFASQTRVKPLGQAMKDAANDLTMTAESVGRLIKIC